MNYFIFNYNIDYYIYQDLLKSKWGLGIGDWGLGIGDWAQSPIPNPQSPIPNPQSPNPKNIIFIYCFYILNNFFNKKYLSKKFIFKL